MSMRGAFLGWSEEYGGYGNEEAAFEAGWNAALQLAETSNSSYSSESKSAAQIFSEMDKRVSDLEKFVSKYFMTIHLNEIGAILNGKIFPV